MLELKNIDGHGVAMADGGGSVIVDGSKIRALDLNMQLGDYEIRTIDKFDLKKDLYVRGTTADNKYLILKVDSFTGDSIKLTMVDKLVFDSYIYVDCICGNLLLISRSHGDNTSSIYNLDTKEFIYTTESFDISTRDIFYGNDKNIIIYSSNNGCHKDMHKGEIVFIKDGVVMNAFSGVEYAINSRAFGCNSGKTFYIKLTAEDVTYAVNFDEETESFKLVDKFDLFINLYHQDIAFVVKDGQLLLYNKITHSTKLLRDFGTRKNRSFKVHPILTFADYYRCNPYVGLEYPPNRHFDKGNKAIIIPANKGIYNTLIDAVSVTYKGVKEIVNAEGVAIDTSLNTLAEIAYKTY